jgi:hypothetical protein
MKSCLVLLLLIALATCGWVSAVLGESQTLGPPNYLSQDHSQIVIFSPLNTTYIKNSIFVNFTVTNFMAVYDVGYSVDGGTIQRVTNLAWLATTPEIVNGTADIRCYNVTYCGKFTVDNLSDGLHSLVIYHGNQQKVVWRDYQPTNEPGKLDIISYREIDFTVDTAAPKISVLSPQGTYNSSKGLSMNLTTNEPTSWIGYSIDNQANVTGTGNATLPNLNAGSHNLEVFANDTAGNMGESSVSNFKINKVSNVTDIFLNQESALFSVMVVVVLVVAFVLLVCFRRRKKLVGKHSLL